MFNVDLIARRIAQHWQSDVALPKPVADLIAVWEESQYALAPATPATADCTVKNVSERIEKLALALAVADKHGEASRRIRDAVAVKLVEAAANALPGIIEQQLQPQALKAAARYAEAVTQLPERFTADDLLVAAPEISAAYNTAVDAARTLKGCENFIRSTSDLPVHGGDPATPLLIVAAATRDDLQAIYDAKAGSPAETKLAPVYRVAVARGLTFRLATVAESDALRAEIDAQPVERKHPQFLRLS
jgi:hypothetical protein